MPKKYLTEEEIEERDRLPWPTIIKYSVLAERNGWTKDQVDEHEQSYIDDLFVCSAEAARSQRQQLKRKPTEKERPWWHGLSDDQIRRELGAGSDVTEAELNEAIERPSNWRDLEDDDDD